MLILLLVSCGGSGGTRGGSSPSGYDLAAARLCRAFEVFVTDARNHKPSRADSQALDDAQAKLNERWGGSTKWAGLSEDINAFFAALTSGDGNSLAQDGKRAGQECATIPAPAQRAGGYTG